MIKRWVLLIAVLLVCPLQASPFAISSDLAPDVWQAPVDAPQQADAYIIEQRIRFDKDRIHHYLLARVQTAAGRNVTRFVFDEDNLVTLEGRVIEPDGRETTFDRKESFVDLLVGKVGKQEFNRRFVIPPAVTSDCIVEMSFSEKAERGLPKDRYQYIIPIKSEYYTLKKEITYSQNLARFSRAQFATEWFNIVTRLQWTPYPDPKNFDQKVQNGYITLTYQNIAPHQQVPFQLERKDSSQSWVYVSMTLPFQGVEVQHFWNTVAKDIVSLNYNPYANGFAKYGHWLRELKDSLSGSPDEMLHQINDAIREQLTAIHMMQEDQLGNIRSQVLERINWWDVGALEEVFNRGYATRTSLAQFAARVCRDLNLKVYLLFPPQDPSSPFDPHELRAFALDYEHPLIGFQSGEHNWTVIAPTHPEYASGEVPLPYQDIPLLAVDLRFSQAKFVKLARTSWQKNQDNYAYNLTFRDDGMLNTFVQRKTTGLFATFNRHQLTHQTEASAKLWFESQLNENMPDHTVFSTQISGLDQANGPVIFKYKTGTQLPLDDARLRLNPFPGSAPFLDNHGYWHNKRDQEIFTLFDGGSLAVSKVQPPDGWQVSPTESWKKENQVGLVSWKVETSNSETKVTRKVILKDGNLPNTEAAAFRDFLSWVEQAYRQNLAFVKTEKVL